MLRPGYKRVLIQPQPGGQLTYARASLDSLYGLIESKWESDGEGLRLAVAIPANTEGVVGLPAQSDAEITEQGMALDRAEGIREVRRDDEQIVIVVGSGQYEFTTKSK